jgi:hypothetical protein
MAAGKFGSSSVEIHLDDGPGGTLRDITAYVTSIGGVKVSQITEKTNPFGTSHEENTPVGMQHVDDITIEGYYDTTATTGPHVVMGTPDDDPQDATRTFTFTPGDSKTFTMECRLVDYSVIATNGNLTKYQSTIRQAGAASWA